MDWLFENLQILVFIGAGIAFWLNSMRQAKEEAEREKNQPPVDLDEVFGPDFDFNSPPEVPSHTEVFLPPPIPTAPQSAEAAQPAPRASRDFPQATPTPQRPQSPHQPASQEAVNAELERQRSLEQRIIALRQNREGRKSGAAATQRSVEAKRAARSGVPDVSPTSTDGIRSRLRSPREARRAIVLREILGSPVGLR